MNGIYANRGAVGFSTARTMLQVVGNIGGRRAVFWEAGGNKNALHMPTFGGIWKNPFKGAGKFFAGDLFYIKTDDNAENPEVYLLKVFKVKSATSTTIKIYRDGFSHIPCVGDVIMKAPDEIGGQGGQASKVTAVVEAVDTVDVWEVTVDTEITGLLDGDILVEAQDSAQTATGTMLVKTINGVAPCDCDFLYNPYTGNPTQAMAEAYVNYAPALGGIMYKHKMSPIPACVEKLNKSRINGLYEV